MEILHELIAIASLILGFYVGYKLGKTKELPKVEVKNIVEKVKEVKEQNKIDEEEAEYIEQLQEDLETIDKYDGGIGG